MSPFTVVISVLDCVTSVISVLIFPFAVLMAVVFDVTFSSTDFICDNALDAFVFAFLAEESAELAISLVLLTSF